MAGGGGERRNNRADRGAARSATAWDAAPHRAVACAEEPLSAASGIRPAGACRHSQLCTSGYCTILTHSSPIDWSPRVASLPLTAPPPDRAPPRLRAVSPLGMAFAAAPMPAQMAQQYDTGMPTPGNTHLSLMGSANNMQSHQHQQQQQAYAPAPAAAAPAASISQLVQALQSGSISKQQLYSSLTDMYKGHAPLNNMSSPPPCPPPAHLPPSPSASNPRRPRTHSTRPSRTCSNNRSSSSSRSFNSNSRLSSCSSRILTSSITSSNPRWASRHQPLRSFRRRIPLLAPAQHRPLAPTAHPMPLPHIGGPAYYGYGGCYVRQLVPTPWGPRWRLVNRCY